MGVASLQVNLRLKEDVELDDLIQRLISTPPRCDSCEEANSLSVAYCKDCADMLCVDCVIMHKKLKALRTHTVLSLDDLKQTSPSEALKLVAAPSPSIRSLPTCPDHKNHQLGFYCCTKCNVPVCVGCTLDKHSLSSGHLVQGLGEHVSQSRAEIIHDIQGFPRT